MHTLEVVNKEKIIDVFKKIQFLSFFTLKCLVSFNVTCDFFVLVTMS